VALPGDTTLRHQADSLYKSGHYFESSIAWERLLFDNADPKEQLLAVLGKTQCLKQEGAFDQALTFLNNWQSYPFPDSDLVRIHAQQVLCSYLGGHFENVVSLLERWPYEHKEVLPAPWLAVLRILSLNELRRWKEAGEAYHTFIAERHTATDLADLYASLPRQKSVNKAQALSTFIPGAGQFYAGRPGEAIFSILVQAAGIYFGVLSFEQHYYVSAWLIGAALFGAFHMGGVRRAEVLVEQYNRKKMLEFNGRVREQLLSLLP
jgi:TM2 domain-containing membrane protein YozV